MDKEVQGKIAERINKYTTAFAEHPNGVAADIIGIIEALGYRKLPKDKPPLLSDGTIKAYVDKYKDNDKPFIFAISLLQAQREADIKHYEKIYT